MFGWHNSMCLLPRIVLNMQDLKSHQQIHSSELSVAGISLWYLDTTFDTTDEGFDESLVNKESNETELQS
ncbi:hypothetical protein D9615_006819 [Tricholomella constricta]|uniref:Uncharacterized protein n=1 Tax=Tricholomella constricta TaxID=117010 RepID=A0A8H5H773_9AGAR|nr:hypothetical protein D9615_006819 [Tricholomella constricta]